MNEKTPLLNQSASNNSEGGSDSEDDSFNLGSFRIPIYGANSSRPTGELVPLDERITYSWSELNVFINETISKQGFYPFRKKIESVKKHILKNVCGTAYPGELLAILGSSGAGKTTFLNALTFRTGKKITVTGIRRVNGIPVTSKSLTSQSAYVQQEDLFIGSLTVKEQLIFQALVRMDRHVTYRQRMQRVEDVISQLSLTNCQNTQIGIDGRIKGISGGERKRLSFAAEVLTNPHLMFCDEPTSGLDSFMALNVVQVLKGMALTGKTIIVTIHQPSSELYAMFDKLLLMAEGRIAFLGTPEEANIFFTSLKAPCPRNYNPADFFIQLLAIVPEKEESCRQAVNSICDKFEQSDLGIKIAVEAASMTQPGHNDIWISDDMYKNPYKASWFSQFRAVLWRSWLSVIKEPLLIKVRLLQTVIISLLIGALFYDQKLDQDGVMNINGVLFLFVTNMTFQNVFAVTNVFCSELPIFLREHRNGMYRTDVYFICKTAADLPIFIVIPVLFTTISYFMIGLNTEGYRFFIACGILVLVSNVATSFGYMISCISTTVSMALSIGPPLIIPFLLFGGFFLNIGSIPVYFEWLSYLSWFRYGNEALLINQWEQVTNITCSISTSSLCYKDGHVVLEILNFHEENLLADIIALACLIVGLRILAFFALLFKTLGAV